MIYAPPSGIFGFFSFLVMIYIFYYFFIKLPKQEKKQAKQAMEDAKNKFLQNEEAKAYLQEGYEIKKSRMQATAFIILN
ncbi:hypothetical protein BKH41_02835 [Helicobacter sp. 12S02232-10]|uniref:hypothetical protein n=1 Tax=Helicobacter sp. 12S02232-10 TaxID=1476197 RepID=UPI000BA7A0E7|nr:hypothetical protein [Helicobacter sp. 12S02232-10]PAF49616.1 hypothetical protein BKH41_02835 [Helicobacter sp. 12S02232-10]